MNGQSLNIKEDIINKLKELIPSCFTEDKLDWEKLRVFFDNKIEFSNERYHLNWAGKTDAIRLLQTPSYNTLKPCKEESKNFDTTENLFIEGDNLEVLKILQKSYFGKIKMIYIDPPYNTGNDFIYKDDYSETLKEYRKKVGDVDENGNATKTNLFRNTKENGQYHSNWLNMMYPRLFLARNLLRDDGVIFVSIDDNEVHNLRLMMDEIFGEENFVGMLPWKARGGRQDSKFLAEVHEYILMYSKTIDEFKIGGMEKNNNVYPKYDEEKKLRYKLQLARKWGSNSRRIDRPNLFYPITAPDGSSIYPKLPNGEDGCWRWSKNRMNDEIENGNIEFVKKGNSWEVYEKIYEPQEGEVRTKKFTTWLDDIGNIANGTKELKELFNEFTKTPFDYPKPTLALKRLLKISDTSDDDLILDFFAGSGTTAHAVMELNKEDGGNRKFILVQLPEPTDRESEAYKAGYKTIADIAKERIRRAAKKIEQELNEEKMKKENQLQLEELEEKQPDLGFKVFKLDESNFKQWRPFIPESPEQIQKAIFDFTENVKPQTTSENILYELMLKNGKKLTDKIENKNGFYIVNEKELVLLIDSVNKEIIDEILKLKPQKVIALDKIFNNNDQLKTNTVLQFKDTGIEFRSV